jgi:UDP-N-acetylmuramoylalanine--D-glutamate ligase
VVGIASSRAVLDYCLCACAYWPNHIEAALMIVCDIFKGKTVALFGLGGSGLATALSLKAGGANVIAYDDAAASQEIARLASIDVQDLRTLNWAQIEALVLAPGVPLTHPVPHWSVELAKSAKVPIIGDLELFDLARRKASAHSKLIAITGTNGKSTTTALITHILSELGANVQMGGNIGKAVLTLNEPHENSVYVVECSSFQIDLAPTFTPDISVLTNITPDHIDRHGTLENYAAIKARLVERAAHAIVSVDDAYCSHIFAENAHNTQSISVNALPDGFVLEDVPTLRGAHNLQNALCAFAAIKALGYEAAAINAAMRSFSGLAHRLEIIGTLNGVLFVNDSKATNADSTEKALLTYPNAYWIAGGKAKEGGIKPLSDFFAQLSHIFLIGKDMEDFSQTLQGFKFERAGTLEKAIRLAYVEALKDRKSNPVILLSPACASYDQYANFEARGEDFRAIFTQIKEA